MSMEIRMLLAIVLSFLIFFVYQTLFVKDTPVHQAPPAKEETVQQPKTAGSENQEKENQVKILEQTAPVTPPVATQTGRSITISTDRYVAVLTEGSGAFRSFRLKKYREALPKDAPMKELIQLPGAGETTPFVSFVGQGAGVGDLAHADFRTQESRDSIDIDNQRKALTFSWTSPQGVTFVKTYTFLPDTYEVGFDVKVRNLSPAPVAGNLAVTLVNDVASAKSSRYAFQGPVSLIDGKLDEVKLKNVEKEGKKTGVVSWIAFETQYFATGLIPKESRKTAISMDLATKDVLDTTYVDPAGPVAPQTEKTYRYDLYLGPKSLDGLKAVGSGFDQILDFGFFDVIAKPFLWVMITIHKGIPNYGVVIILITILVKMLFWPLSNKSYQSMSQMKRLQPKMAEIRAKYKDDKKMMNQELMNLYKIYKVNPLGGCLPMILQIPVFFAFYKMLLQSIELRHAPFFLWINDLSAPDRLFHFNIKVPLMAPPYGIPVLTLIMGASMLLQQKMSPPPGDPAQAKMMMFMPIFFTFIFINFPSGLVLYWLTNNILSMAQQYYVTKKTA